MADDTLEQLIGTSTGRSVITVERGHVARFADAVQDPSPVYRDPRAASAAGLPGIPAPPTYPFVMGNFGRYPELQVDDDPPGSPVTALLGSLLAGGGLILHGEQELTYRRPVLVGDVLVGEGRVADAYRKESGGHTMTFVVVETIWRDRDSGEEVTTSRMTVLHRS